MIRVMYICYELHIWQTTSAEHTHSIELSNEFKHHFPLQQQKQWHSVEQMVS